MFIENIGGTAYLQPDYGNITLAMTDPTGTVTINQMGTDSATWFEYKENGVSMALDSNNTARAISAPIKLQVVAVGTGVRLYNRKQPNKIPVIIQST